VPTSVRPSAVAGTIASAQQANAIARHRCAFL
jgi:hypothetical protein